MTLAAFAIAAVWIALSAARHSKAEAACKTNFFGTNTALEDEGNTLCNIFPWADVGIMGGLFVLLAIMQARVAQLFSMAFLTISSRAISTSSSQHI